MTHPAESRWKVERHSSGWYFAQRYGSTTNYALGSKELSRALNVLAIIAADPVDTGWGSIQSPLLSYDDERMCHECGRFGVRYAPTHSGPGYKVYECVHCANRESYP